MTAVRTADYADRARTQLACPLGHFPLSTYNTSLCFCGRRGRKVSKKAVFVNGLLDDTAFFW